MSVGMFATFLKGKRLYKTDFFLSYLLSFHFRSVCSDTTIVFRNQRKYLESSHRQTGTRWDFHKTVWPICIQSKTREIIQLSTIGRLVDFLTRIKFSNLQRKKRRKIPWIKNQRQPARQIHSADDGFIKIYEATTKRVLSKEKLVRIKR